MQKVALDPALVFGVSNNTLLGLACLAIIVLVVWMIFFRGRRL